MCTCRDLGCAEPYWWHQVDSKLTPGREGQEISSLCKSKSSTRPLVVMTYVSLCRVCDCQLKQHVIRSLHTRETDTHTHADGSLLTFQSNVLYKVDDASKMQII
eukprot:Blabericola_migrator_1__5612@NODE_2854_length_2284_cov_85_475417_g1790_i0_p2_GENE_NODE_2854_length_2284_cov_85_475417_g1790_i0NODE_2854_length_2284_cov_85_475417_g1790_i0_p2_ORF_typecomplete_len104_score4_66_NODE_2854_length_2284_cov_85_475417_g1790_i019152226